MKKLLATALAFCTATSFAAEQSTTAQTSNDAPRVALGVVDVSGKAPRPIKGTKISRSKKQQLCWSSINVPLTGRMRVAEAFYAPGPTNFASPGMTVNASEDKKEFLIIGDMIAQNNENITRCWSFDKKDPIGKYRMEVQIGNYVFKDLTFEVVK